MKLFLKNIGKIAETTVEIKGISVIAGENNTGKSTVGKALFSVFNSFYKIQEQILQERINSIVNILQLIHRNVYFHVFEQRNIYEFARDILNKENEYKKEPGTLINEIYSMLDFPFGDSKVISEKSNIEDIANRIIEILKISDDDIFQSVISKKMNSEFNGQPLNIYSKSDGKIILNIKGQELIIKVSKEAVSADDTGYSLNTEAIYIDDPLVLDEIDNRMVVRNQNYLDHRMQLESKLLEGENNTNVVEEIVVENKFKKIYEKLLPVCNGNIVVQKNKHIGYQLDNQDRALSVKNLSTGLKTFAILKTLITNGAIKDNGTIILDEPEIHLHPKWQLLFAELIVLLHKDFGMHILLNTHSPYFLRAIQVYSAEYEVSDMCKYYLSETGEEGEAYINDVTNSIDKIYEKLSTPLQWLENKRWSND